MFGAIGYTITMFLSVYRWRGIGWVYSPVQQNHMEVRRSERDLAQRPKDVHLEDIMIIRSKGSRMIKPKNIHFDDED